MRTQIRYRHRKIAIWVPVWFADFQASLRVGGESLWLKPLSAIQLRWLRQMKACSQIRKRAIRSTAWPTSAPGYGLILLTPWQSLSCA
jgi:hypothetical protein